jgi:hypothetical protein
MSRSYTPTKLDTEVLALDSYQSPVKAPMTDIPAQDYQHNLKAWSKTFPDSILSEATLLIHCYDEMQQALYHNLSMMIKVDI